MYRLLPRTRKNWRLLERVLEDQRQLYNAALQERNDAWRLAGRSISYVDQTKALTVCRRDLPEMAAMPVAIQRGTLRRVDEAFKGFFRRVRARTGAVGYPRFKSRRGFDSITVVSGVKLEAGPRGTSGGQLRLPGLGWLTIRRRGDTPHAQGRPVSAVLKREAGRWYVIVCFRVPAAPRNTPGGSADNGVALGVDMNGQIAASDGRLFHAPDTRRLEARAKRLSRKLARQKARFAPPGAHAPAPCEDPSAHDGHAAQLAPSGHPAHRGCGRHRLRRSPACAGHDAERQGHG